VSDGVTVNGSTSIEVEHTESSTQSIYPFKVIERVLGLAVVAPEAGEVVPPHQRFGRALGWGGGG
jgi:hypothetical protein